MCCLARAACLPRGLYVLLALISLFIFLNEYLSKIRPLSQDSSDRFSPNFHHNGRYLIVDY